MNLLESSWFLISSMIIGIVLLVDPKSSNTNAVSGLFSSPSSGQQFIYNFSANKKKLEILTLNDRNLIIQKQNLKYNEQGKFIPWVMRIAYNLSIDYFRKRNKTKFVRSKDDFNIDLKIFCSTL